MGNARARERFRDRTSRPAAEHAVSRCYDQKRPILGTAAGTLYSTERFLAERFPPRRNTDEAAKVYERGNMIGWALTFLLVAIVAAVFGFGGVAGAAVGIAKLIFFVALVLFAISAAIGLLRGRRPSI